VKIGFNREDGLIKYDSVFLDESGTFIYENAKLKKPALAYIFLNNKTYNYILIAPGFDLKLEANVVSDSSLKKSIKISGIGAEVNQYKVFENKNGYKPKKNLWFLETYDEFSKELEKIKLSQKRIIEETFSEQTLIKPWSKQFKKYLEIYYYYLNAEYVFFHITEFKYPEENAVSTIKKLISEDFFEILFNDENQFVPWHQGFLNPTYIDYLKMIDKKREQGITKKQGYTLSRIYSTFKEPFRDKTMYSSMQNTMFLTNDILRLRRIDSSYQKFYPLIKEPFVSELKRYYKERETFLTNTKKGNPAPPFKGLNSEGNTITLEKFKGKVLFIDFWASWCGPCRRETPFLKQLHDSLKGYDDFALLSIAVSDQKSKWEKATLEENVKWISILDDDNTSKTNYFTGNGIPKFVLINKEGNIFNFNAPRPSESMETLIKIIREELKK